MSSNFSVSPEQLPRLLYIGDVPVEASSHGSALIYRLLQNYPPEKLRIIEGNLRNSLPERRLAGVAYSSFRVGWARPLHTRFTRWAHLAYSYAVRWKIPALGRSVGDFRPEAVLTVAHDFLWLAAARYARQKSLPLHLICHDDWTRMARVPPVFRGWLEGEFSKVYRQAASRLCVSPYMAEEYERRYGAKGAVLYPSRAKDCPKIEEPPSRLQQPPEKFTVAYAGNVFSRGYWDALGKVAEVLAPMKGRLVLFTPHTRDQARAAGLVSQNVECRGFMKSEDLIQQLRNEADVLFIPMSFDKADRCNMEISFPSKLTDATIPGVPLLIYGPDYCSAVRWARENIGVAEVVTHSEVSELETVLHRLNHPSHRFQMGEAALRAGREFFSHPTAQNSLYASLAQTSAISGEDANS